ncbi:MAG TPA: hypothetical protein VN033_15010 [Vulgatibacter sp.]|nr:hypothetical protein [Vulgatibacter sp.]
MKRAFDSNVSRAKPRTRMLEAFAPEPEEKISADLAAIIAKPSSRERGNAPSRERGKADPAARVARTAAGLAGEAASAVSAQAEPKAQRKDALVATEEKLALQASEAAHETSRARERGSAVALVRGEAAKADAAGAKDEARAAARVAAPAPAPKAEARPMARDASSGGKAEAETEAEAEETSRARPQAEKARVDAIPSADLAATVRQELRSAARPSARVEEAPRPAPAFGVSDDLGRTIARAHAARGRMAAPAADTVREGRARIEELRGRLRATEGASHSPDTLQPAGAAAAVRVAVADLRARLAAALSERDELARTLEATRDDLRRVGQELAARTRELEAARQLAAERASVAEELAAEGEALAEERDQALARILELKSLDEQQTRLLEEAQAALAERDRRLSEGAAQTRELVGLIDAQAVEIEDLHARLAESSREGERTAARIAAQEAELRKLVGTREALTEIQRLISSAAD